MSRRLTERQKAKRDAAFDYQAASLLGELGARDEGSRGYVLDTPYGRLVVTPSGSWCALQFEEVVLAAAAPLAASPDFNPHSGKFNFQTWSDDLPVEDRVAQLRRRLVGVGAERTR